jgi:hypothetical protein
MPAMTETEIKAKIADGTVFGVSIDTAIFDKYGCNLDSTVLKSLTQFREGPITLLFSEIVVNGTHRRPNVISIEHLQISLSDGRPA